MTDALAKLTDALAETSMGEVQYALRRLRAIERWALSQQPVAAGDRVRIVHEIDFSRARGWSSGRECLAVGATAEVRSVDFNTLDGRWFAQIILDREWSVGTITDEVRRYWHGPAEDTPEGFTPPSRYDQEHHPAGRKHLYAMPTSWLEPLDD
jgi:hypothetical protein